MKSNHITCGKDVEQWHSPPMLACALGHRSSRQPAFISRLLLLSKHTQKCLCACARDASKNIHLCITLNVKSLSN